ncbi:hypothetical protein TrCOL_g11868 [Triparma columacea]|uniref:Uncharacterized protein n=1 Tax=Triparma columacea TaxID=722753 RepID=A0A9W7G629_9STRA|nr:hypothetical protein TrCOL_g11868 [Triparma columacea]
MQSLPFSLILPLLLLLSPLPTHQISDFEASQAALATTSYKSMACWYGSCSSDSEADIKLTAEPLPVDPYIPAPTPSPEHSPTEIPSYIKKMSSPTADIEAASSGTSTTATSLPVLKFTNVPASVYKNSVFSLTVIYYDEGLKEIIYNDPEGNYASGFDVRLSIGQAEAQDDSLGKWVIYDLVLTGTLTRELKYGSVEFSGLTLNIPGTVVYFKVEATNAAYGLSSTNTQYIAVTELTSEIEEIIAAAANQETAEIPDISTYDPELNQITADASISVGVKLGDITVEDTTSHSHFSGTFIVADYYEDSSCTTNPLYNEYIKKSSCISLPGGNSSRVITDYTSVQISTSTYAGVDDCRVKPANATSLLGNRVDVVESRGQCLESDISVGVYKKYRAVKSSIGDTGVCEGPVPVVRVAEWFGSDGLGTCHANVEDRQPTVRLFEIGKCYKVQGKAESFIFTGCYHKNSGLLTQFIGSATCEGVNRNQREWGGVEEDSCFVGSVEGWGVQGGEDISVQCGVTCTT